MRFSIASYGWSCTGKKALSRKAWAEAFLLCTARTRVPEALKHSSFSDKVTVVVYDNDLQIDQGLIFLDLWDRKRELLSMGLWCTSLVTSKILWNCFWTFIFWLH